MTESEPPTGSPAADPILPAAHIASANFKLPTFWDGDAELWFLHIEALFRSHRIASQRSRFDFVVAALPQATAAIVRDILRAPPDNPFDHLKDELIRRTTASEQRRLQQLLTSEELGDRKPTDLLRRMHQLLGDRPDRVEEPIFRELFLQRLPSNVRMILSASEIASTEALARMADRIMEVNTPAIATLSSTTPSSNQAVDRLERLNDVVLQLSRKMDQLSSEVSSLRVTESSFSSNRRGSSRFRPRASRSPSAEASGLCWYHKRFGDMAHRCISPCSYQGNSPTTH